MWENVSWSLCPFFDPPSHSTAPERQLRAILNKSLTRRASVPRAVCGVANPRHSWGYGCGLRRAAHPKPRRPRSRGLVQRRLSSLAKVSVDTDANGMVVLSGTTNNKATADKAESIAKATEGVTSVQNKITVKKDS